MDSATTISGSDSLAEKRVRSKAEEWELMPKVREIDQINTSSGFKRRELGLTWDKLTVTVESSDHAIHENIFSQFNIAENIRRYRHKLPLKTILDQSHGCVHPGEMLLVLGRPGSGCTTLLKLLANKRAGFAHIDGDIRFGSMPHDEAAKYRGEIIMNTEEEVFFPTLTVGQIMDFATRLKVPAHLPSNVNDGQEYAAQVKDFLLKSLGISHTENTKVGNEYIRGVSGGERKRVSILECLASRGSIYCWDNSTRGLDASSALDWAKAMRAMTDVFGLATVVTLYQAGNDIYRLFDKVLVLDQGKQIYYGPTDQAQGFMEDLGFICQEGANIADFLTSVTVPTERYIKPGFESKFPSDADSIREQYQKSSTYAELINQYDYPSSQIASSRTLDFQQGVVHDRTSKNSQFTASFLSQVRALVDLQFQILRGDKATFAMKQGSTLIQALIAGSLYYNAIF